MIEEHKICMRCNHVDVLHSPEGTNNYICKLEPRKIVDACSCCDFYNCSEEALKLIKMFPDHRYKVAEPEENKFIIKDQYEGVNLDYKIFDSKQKAEDYLKEYLDMRRNNPPTSIQDLFKKFGLVFDKCKITKIYRGKNHYCRCGCGGTYYDEPISKRILSNISRVLKNFDYTDYYYYKENDESWIDISRDYNQAYTIYFKEEEDVENK